MYCGHTSSLIAVDVDFATEAFVKLFNAPEMRNKMGAAGRQRAMNVYEWEVIIPQYEELWANLEELYAQFASMLNQPMTKFAIALNGTITKFAQGLQSLKEQKQ